MHASSGTNPGSGRVAQYEVDVASYLWSESPGDLPSDAGWVSVSQRGQQHQRSSLAMKTQALTPCVQNFCSSMDAKLKARLDDLQYYLPSQDTGEGNLLNQLPSVSSVLHKYTAPINWWPIKKIDLSSPYNGAQTLMI